MTSPNPTLPGLDELEADPASAWDDCGASKLVSLDQAVAAPHYSFCFKREPRVRIMLTAEQPDGHRYICKIYRVPRLLRWRTVLMASRANREYAIQIRARRAGLRVVRPECWKDVRSHGLLSFSLLVLRFEPGVSLEAILRDPASGVQRRLEMAGAAGGLIRHLHTGGFFWASAYPRNVLLPDSGAGFMALDTPYAEQIGGDLTASEFAWQDLQQLAWNGYGDWGFTEAEHEAIIGGYCGGDHTLFDQVRAGMVRRGRWTIKVKRAEISASRVLTRSDSESETGGSYTGD